MSAVAIPAPVRETRRPRRVPDPCAIVIFGATGDLAHRKLMPALYTLSRLGMMPAEYAVVGFARRPMTDDVFRQEMAKSVLGSAPDPSAAATWAQFANRLLYVQADFHDAAGYERLRGTLERLDRQRGTAGNRLFYLATAPELYGEIVNQLGAHQLVLRPAPGRETGRPWARVIVEKPFGRDLASAQELNRLLLGVFRESHRMDGPAAKLELRAAKQSFENVNRSATKSKDVGSSIGSMARTAGVILLREQEKKGTYRIGNPSRLPASSVELRPST